MANELIVEKKEHIMTITLNRPEKRNAMNLPLMAKLCRAWIDLRDDPELWVGIITGAGDRAFCSGGDLKSFIPQAVGHADEIRQGQVQLDWGGEDVSGLPQNAATFAVLRDVEIFKPIIAAVNGFCTAGGLEMIQGTDIRIASENATFGIFEPKWGLFPGGGSTVKLVRQVPFSRAMELLVTGRLLTAQDAYDMGLVSKIVPLSELMNEAQKLAEDICGCGPLAVQAIKKSIYYGSRMTMKEHLQYEEDLSAEVFMTEDAQEGLRAFLEKRKPQWKMR